MTQSTPSDAPALTALRVDALIEAIRGATATLAAAQTTLAQVLGDAVRLLAERPGAAASARAPVEDRLLSVKDAARYLGMSRDTVYRLVETRKIPYVAGGRRRLLARADLDAWIASHKVKVLGRGKSNP